MKKNITQRSILLGGFVGAISGVILGGSAGAITTSWSGMVYGSIAGIILGVRILRNRGRFIQIKLNSIPWLLILLCLIILLTTLENGSHSPSNPDTGIYHAQAIKWIETYPAVPGLGNLHSRFAYDSSWLVINAFFSFSFLGLRSFHVLPGAFLVIILMYFLGGRIDCSEAILLSLTF